MTAVRRHVSISQKQDGFLRDSGLNLSQLVQEVLMNMMRGEQGVEGK